MEPDQVIIERYLAWISRPNFPCVGAKAALGRDQIKCVVADQMNSTDGPGVILKFLYAFVDQYRAARRAFHSAAVIFRGPKIDDDHAFDQLFWIELQALIELDRKNYGWDKRVDSNPSSPHYSFSIKEEAFFVIGIHPASSRRSRRFDFPAIIFNPHAEFERLRKTNRFDAMKRVVQKRDTAYSGSVNPTLKDFGEASEVFQYSGVHHPADWKCPLPDHGKDEHHSTS